MHVDELMVRPGERVEAAGTLVRTGPDRFAIAYDEGMPTFEIAAFYPVMSSIVPVQPTPQSSMAELVGDHVMLSGTWFDGIVVESTTSQGEPSHSSVQFSAEEFRPVPHPIFAAPVYRNAEKPLMEAGYIARRTATADQVVMVAFDPDVVSAALLPVYGESLVVVPSPWPASTYRQIEDVWKWADDAGLLIAIGDLPQDAMAGRVVAINVTLVDESLAERLESIPDGPLVVKPFVGPARAAHV